MLVQEELDARIFLNIDCIMEQIGHHGLHTLLEIQLHHWVLKLLKLELIVEIVTPVEVAIAQVLMLFHGL